MESSAIIENHFLKIYYPLWQLPLQKHVFKTIPFLFPSIFLTSSFKSDFFFLYGPLNVPRVQSWIPSFPYIYLYPRERRDFQSLRNPIYAMTLKFGQPSPFFWLQTNISNFPIASPLRCFTGKLYLIFRKNKFYFSKAYPPWNLPHLTKCIYSGSFHALGQAALDLCLECYLLAPRGWLLVNPEVLQLNKQTGYPDRPPFLSERVHDHHQPPHLLG